MVCAKCGRMLQGRCDACGRVLLGDKSEFNEFETQEKQKEDINKTRRFR